MRQLTNCLLRYSQKLEPMAMQNLPNNLQGFIRNQCLKECEAAPTSNMVIKAGPHVKHILIYHQIILWLWSKQLEFKSQSHHLPAG